MPRATRSNSTDDRVARLVSGEREFSFRGRWVEGGPWQRFGLYNSYVVLRQDGAVMRMPAHAGELVPGSTEDLVNALRQLRTTGLSSVVPMTVELDPTYRCASVDCGGHCFSAEYRSNAPLATVPTPVIEGLIDDFSRRGGRVLRFDGGGDPLLHADVRNGNLVQRASDRDLKTTILTSGDLLHTTNVEKISEAGCYLRVSLNASTDETRQAFHGNRVPLQRILARMADATSYVDSKGLDVPVGATYLLDETNYEEVLASAIQARDVGVAHFSVRRVLGPAHLRPRYEEGWLDRAHDLLLEVDRLMSDDFRVFVPGRSLDEPDLDPSRGQIKASLCWQSIFKTVVEPTPVSNGAQAQLCGRYRGSGVGQAMQLPPVTTIQPGDDFVQRLRNGRDGYSLTAHDLLRTCTSCIDRGFIVMVDRLVSFLGPDFEDFEIFHLDSDELDRFEPLVQPAQGDYGATVHEHAPRVGNGERHQAKHSADAVELAVADPQRSRKSGRGGT